MTEYRLEKKGLGRWEYVTWYSDKQEALLNLHNAATPLNGYSWRVVEINTIEQINLEDHTEPEPPEIVQDKPKSNGWGQVASWADFKTSVNPGPIATPSTSQLVHGLVGSVWLVHHGQRAKVRVKASEAQRYIDEGYVRGGPKTKFE